MVANNAFDVIVMEPPIAVSDGNCTIVSTLLEAKIAFPPMDISDKSDTEARLWSVKSFRKPPRLYNGSDNDVRVWLVNSKLPEICVYVLTEARG